MGKESSLNCSVCGQRKHKSLLLPPEMLRPKIVELIKLKKPDWSPTPVCFQCIESLRNEWVESYLFEEKGELSHLEKKVLQSFKNKVSISENINLELEQKMSFADALSDRIASFGGSWAFIIIFMTILWSWILINSFLPTSSQFDPYPFILMNLILSCIAALQAPIIMMSQNRQERKDRIRNEHDYQVNLKAELEIRELHAKMDQLMTQHWQHLLEIQHAQMEMLNDQTQILMRKSGAN